jgi:tetrahydromethanopterin S-methyltransferase subunit A
MKKTVKFKADPKGFFYVYVDERSKKIVVEHYRNIMGKVSGREMIISGRPDMIFRGTSAEKLYREILAHKIISLQDHAAYLGSELAKAEIALKNKLDYEQDEELML